MNRQSYANRTHPYISNCVLLGCCLRFPISIDGSSMLSHASAMPPIGIGNTCFPFASILNCTKPPSPGRCQKSTAHTGEDTTDYGPPTVDCFRHSRYSNTMILAGMWAHVPHFRRSKSCSMISLLVFEWANISVANFEKRVDDLVGIQPSAKAISFRFPATTFDRTEHRRNVRFHTNVVAIL